ncbi:hypothetical protein DUNSADRAFT_12353 [Dunaliella salina]|uniref:Encoded protein n=1 Tax=Dunaliella salina TaxID=3046 RepID=A0ABQ7GBR5_DUNSA|nr:hypothetical protein DUNSADRAFT_12353 [Dunaliella salina]|eukprot:KAF5831958.1 hypothetical protein DUNSADRAFT_12353 [Dunaliella salina]
MNAMIALCAVFQVVLLALTRVGARNVPPPTFPSYYEASPQMEVLSADARIYLFRNFLSEAECDYIRNKATPRLARSGVVDTKTGKSKIDDIRTSSGMFFNRGEDPVIQTIERRIANLSMTPVYHGEGLQVGMIGR